MFSRKYLGFGILALGLLVFQTPGISQSLGRGEDKNITYSKGQSVSPVYQGWLKNPDGTYDLYFSYVNLNWQEELYIPVGPNNNIAPAQFGPDAGQPTHFYPRINRWQFSIRVPADFGNKEIVWTLTSYGKTYRAYATLNPGYEVDEFIIMHEYGNSQRGRKPPTVTVEGAKQRTVRVGEPVQVVATVSDPNAVAAGRGAAAGRGGGGRGGRGAAPRSNSEIEPGTVGGDFIRSTARGLYLGWLIYRGPGEAKFDPPIGFKLWEDQRGGSPWAPGWQPPPVPEGNRWVHTVTFSEPGTYVLRAQARDGFWFANDDITITVTRAGS